MSNDNYILTDADLPYLEPAELQKWANYEGDHPAMLAKRAMSRKLLLLNNPAMESRTLQKWLDSPIDVLNGSMRLMNVLKNTGFLTVRQVYEAGYEYLLKQNNFGLRCKDDLDKIFREHGLILRPQPTSAPLEQPAEQHVNETDVCVTLPLKLLSDMVNACHHNLAHYERQHGRFASRGNYKAEHDRLLGLVQAAEELIANFEDRDHGC